MHHIVYLKACHIHMPQPLTYTQHTHTHTPVEKSTIHVVAACYV